MSVDVVDVVLEVVQVLKKNRMETSVNRAVPAAPVRMKRQPELNILLDKPLTSSLSSKAIQALIEPFYFSADNASNVRLRV